MKNTCRNSTFTGKVQLDTHKCIACWQCLTVCPCEVIGRVNLWWHKHARFSDATKCIGCLKCVKACSSHAFTKV